MNHSKIILSPMNSCRGVKNMGNKPHHAIVLASAVSANLAGGAILGIFLGGWVDDLLAAKPIFTIIGLLLGLAAGIYGMVTTVRKFTETGDNKE
jgi:ATP synthase protein I